MLLDFEVRNCSRVCASTGRALEPGDVYFSVLEVHGAELSRSDYCAEAWKRPPETCLGWWRSRVPTKDDAQPQLAPVDVLINLFVALAERPDDAPFRYLLALLLLRRRVLRREDVQRDAQDQETWLLYCPRRRERFELAVAEPNEQDAERLQQRMIDLLYGGDTEPDLVNG